MGESRGKGADGSEGSSAAKLFCFGLGYTATALVRELQPAGWRIAGTCRDEPKRERLALLGITPFCFDGTRPMAEAERALAGTTHLLVSIPPDERGDSVLGFHREQIAALDRLQWIGYLSSTSVYGDHGGEWVDESTPPAPTGPRGQARLDAENLWLSFARAHGLPLHVFRLAGIYGSGRSVLNSIRAGNAQRVIKPSHVFNRAHVADIVNVLCTSMGRPSPGRIYNVCDDEPAGRDELVQYACKLLGRPEPPPVRFEEAGLSSAARAFYADNKRVRNRRIKEELGVTLSYPDFRAGLAAIRQAEEPDLD